MENETILTLMEREQNSKGSDLKDGHNVFSTIGELHKTDLSCLVLDLDLLHNIEEAINEIDRKPKIQYYGTGRYKGYFSIVCILQKRKSTVLKVGKREAYIYNCDKPALSGIAELTVKKNYLGQFTWEDS